jgi:hypothetical protein
MPAPMMIQSLVPTFEASKAGLAAAPAGGG